MDLLAPEQALNRLPNRLSVFRGRANLERGDGPQTSPESCSSVGFDSSDFMISVIHERKLGLSGQRDYTLSTPCCPCLMIGDLPAQKWRTGRFEVKDDRALAGGVLFRPPSASLPPGALPSEPRSVLARPSRHDGNGAVRTPFRHETWPRRRVRADEARREPANGVCSGAARRALSCRRQCQCWCSFTAVWFESHGWWARRASAREGSGPGPRLPGLERRAPRWTRPGRGQDEAGRTGSFLVSTVIHGAEYRRQHHPILKISMRPDHGSLMLRRDKHPHQASRQQTPWPRIRRIMAGWYEANNQLRRLFLPRRHSSTDEGSISRCKSALASQIMA